MMNWKEILTFAIVMALVMFLYDQGKTYAAKKAVA